MAICTQCGVIMHELDIQKHKCDTALIPAAGFEKKPVSVTVEVSKDV